MASPPRSLNVRRKQQPAAGKPKSLASVPRTEPSPERMLVVWGVLIASTGLLAINLFYVQIVKGSVLQKIAQQRQQAFLQPFVPRRQIVDRTGNVLAIDRPVYGLFVHPKLFKQSKEAIANQLAPILNRPAADLVKKFNERESGIRLEYALREDTADRIYNLQLDGIERIQQQQRIYPQQELVAGVVGYVNDEHKGQSGVELSQQNLLERSVKPLRVNRMGDGTLMPDQVPGGFLNLDELQLKLTLDSRLQRVAIAALKQQMKKFSAKRGTVIVMDVQDGSLLTLADEPSYDPNQYYKFPVERFKNWALTDLYEPGSTFKPINVAIALEAKTIKPDSLFNDTGQMTIDGWTIGNFDGVARGLIPVTKILQYSSNVGMVRIIETMKPGDYYQWLKRLGIGEAVSTDLPAFVAGQIKDKKTFVEARIEPATAAFGQGFSLTAIQLAQLHAAIANGGKLVSPHVVQGLFDSKGQPYWQPNSAAFRQVFSKETTQAVLPMMETVVKEGTGKPAQIASYRIGGKTGTAQKASPNGGYYAHAKITSFVGVFPIEAPRFVVVTVVDEPQGGDAFGSTVAAPVVKAMIEALIAIEKIPPAQPSADLKSADPPLP